jgi:HK97 family phage major capsid protein
MDLENQLSSLHREFKGWIDGVQSRQNGLQRQVDAIDSRTQGHHAGSIGGRGLEDILRENDSVGRLLADKKGIARINFKGRDAELFERKTVLTELVSGSIGTQTAAPVGMQTTGVLPIERIPGITPEPRQQLFVRDVLPARPTTAALVDYVRVNAPMTIASPVPEGSVKPENAVTFTANSEKIRTVATWIPASRQILDDYGELRTFIDGSLRYYLDLAEEQQMLSGDGTGENLHGIIPQATAFQTALLVASSGWTRLDVVGRAIEQLVNAKEIAPTFAVVNTADWWNMRLTKDSLGKYILGEPQLSVVPALFGLRVIPTVNVSAGTFLVGSGSQVSIEIVDRMETQVEVSTEHSDYFTRNLVAVRAEKRLALVIKRPTAYVTGTFTTSP